jgi:hypothetical protein
MPAGSQVLTRDPGASATLRHFFADSFLRVVGRNGGMVSIAALGTGAATIDIQSGARTIMRNSNISSNGAALTRNPNLDTDRVASFPAAPGEEIFIDVTDTSGAANPVRILLVVRE